VKGTPLWDLIYDPDCDVTTIRINSGVIKIKKYFLRENDHSTVLLFRNKVFIKILITDGDITEYESLPPKTTEKEGSNIIAWLYTKNHNYKLYHKQVREGSLC
jgi:hypothetical protein